MRSDVTILLRKLSHILLRFCKWFFLAFGVLSFILFVLSFTDLPYYAYYYLGTSNKDVTTNPDVIVVLGGGGMPSPDGLIRTYYASLAALNYKDGKG